MSASAYGGETVRVAYSASKAAVGALTRHVANRWGKEGVHCNAVVPA
jgi:NAD(P)-dependent dehydrogenase (short-subunit alcohol dehydrogenase family)